MALGTLGSEWSLWPEGRGIKARFFPYRLVFHRAAGTSRGQMLERLVHFIELTDSEGVVGRGECAPLPGLSLDDRPDLMTRLSYLCQQFNAGEWAAWRESLDYYPSLRMGFEMALYDLRGGGGGQWYDSPFTRGEKSQRINGLIWMGTPEDMHGQIRDRIAEGFRCIKCKIGALDFEQELALLHEIRSEWPFGQLDIRLDANGAFSAGDVLHKLDQLAAIAPHSIEQPVRAGQTSLMAEVCRQSPIPVALDEELIPLTDAEQAMEVLEVCRPAYLILKPSLLGGFADSEQWIARAAAVDAGWWVTSALESNVGLAALSAWTSTLNNPLPQGLGTGKLYKNNIPSPLLVRSGDLHWDASRHWEWESCRDNL